MAKTKQGTSSQTHQLRIIGGQWRGRKLAIKSIDGLRPTGDRIRETLFNWLMADISASRCLDLFAGSGALGLESLSRGAAEVTLLEKHPQAALQLQQHCTKLGTSNSQVIQADCLLWLQQTNLPKSSIDIVFIDPPFGADLWQATIDALASSQLLKVGALIYVESPRNTHITPPKYWYLHREKQTGQICYRLYQYLAH